MRTKEQFPKKLLVEGNDDQHVIWALCEKFKVTHNFDVIDCEGIDNLLLQIPIRFKQSDLNALGIIIDADTDIKKRWASLSSQLAEQGFSLPETIPNEGLVMEKNGIRIGVWIMPNNNLNGMLEDFISFLIPKDDKLQIIAQDTLESIEQKKLDRYKPSFKSKALLHSWLSWQDDPGTPMGWAITKKYLTTDEANCLRLINWLKAIFT